MRRGLFWFWLPIVGAHLAALAVCLGGTPDIPKGATQVYKAVPDGMDEVVGKTAFNVISTSDTEAQAIPIAMPSFKLEHVAGPKLPLGFAQCLVIKRVVYTDLIRERFYVVVALKCGSKEYSVGEVDFQMSTVEGK